MTAALTPAGALEYLGELSTDIRAAVILDSAGVPLAGDSSLAEPGRDLLGATESSRIAVSLPAGRVFAARNEHNAIVIAAASGALPALALYDLKTVLEDLRERSR